MKLLPFTKHVLSVFRDADKGGAGGGTAGTETKTDATATSEELGDDAGDPTGSKAFLAALDLPEDLRKEVEPPKPAKKDEKSAGSGQEPGKKPDAKADPEDAEDPHGVPKDQREAPHIVKMQGRIAKVVGQRNELRDEVTELKAKLEEATAKAGASPAASAAPSDSVFAGVETPEQLATLVGDAKRTLAWYDQVEEQWESDGIGAVAVTDGKGGTREIPAKEVKLIKRRAETILRDQRDHAATLQAQAGYNAKAAERFAYLAKPADERTTEEKLAVKTAGDLLRRAPELRRFPDHQYLIHLFAQAILAEAKAPKQDKTSEEEPEDKDAPEETGAAQEKSAVKKTPLAPPPPLGAGASGAGGRKSAPASAERADDEVSGPLDQNDLTELFRKKR